MPPLVPSGAKVTHGRDRLLHYLAATATDVAKVRHRLDVFPEAVLETGAHNDLPIHRACLNKSAAAHKILRLILSRAPELVRCRGRHDALPLHMACANTSSVKVVKDLIAMYPGAGTFVTARGDFALHHAALNQTPAALEILRYILIPNFEAIMKPGSNGDLPLHIACAVQPRSVVVRELISQDARALRVKNSLGDLPLHRVCLNTGPEAALVLKEVLAETHPVAKGVPLYPEAVEKRAQGGNCALHLACGNSNSVDVVRALVAAWPEACSLKNDEGNYPIHCCCMNRHSGVVQGMIEVLLELCPEATEMRGLHGSLPLHVAAEFSCSLDAVKLLITKHKYATFVKSEKGEMPGFCAQRNTTAAAVEIQEEIFKAYPEAHGEKDPDKLHLQVKSLTDNFFPWDEPSTLMRELHQTLAGDAHKAASKKPESKKPEQKAGMKLPEDSPQITGRWWTAGLTRDNTCKEGQLTRADPHGAAQGFEHCIGRPVRHVDRVHHGSTFCIGHHDSNHRSGPFVRLPRRSKTPVAVGPGQPVLNTCPGHTTKPGTASSAQRMPRHLSNSHS